LAYRHAHLFTIHIFSIVHNTFQTRSWHNPADIYCLVQNKLVCDLMLNEVKRRIILASPERILLDFESATVNAFRAAIPSATVTGCYFHLTQIVMRKVDEIDLK